MKKIILVIYVLVSTLAFGQEEVPFRALGVWQNTEEEVVVITRAENLIVFTRKNKTKILAQGEITLVQGELHINRFDTDDEYRLGFFIGNETMVIKKPNSIRAWLWTRIQ